jgi:hypothetical protein
VIAISSDRALTTTNIPWIFRLPDRTSLEQALGCLSAAGTQAGANRGKIRELLSSVPITPESALSRPENSGSLWSHRANAKGL